MKTYQEKKQIADQYLSQFGVSWDTLPDINSLHDIEPDLLTEQDIHDAIIDACHERLQESGFPFEELNPND